MAPLDRRPQRYSAQARGARPVSSGRRSRRHRGAPRGPGSWRTRCRQLDRRSGNPIERRRQIDSTFRSGAEASSGRRTHRRRGWMHPLRAAARRTSPGQRREGAARDELGRRPTAHEQRAHRGRCVEQMLGVSRSRSSCRPLPEARGRPGLRSSANLGGVRAREVRPPSGTQKLRKSRSRPTSSAATCSAGASSGASRPGDRDQASVRKRGRSSSSCSRRDELTGRDGQVRRVERPQRRKGRRRRAGRAAPPGRDP